MLGPHPRPGSAAANFMNVLRESPRNLMTTAVPFSRTKPRSIARYENVAVVAIILIMSFLPNLAKFGAPAADESGSIVGQLVYGSIYIFAAIRLVALRARFKKVLLQSVPMAVYVGILFASTFWSTNSATTLRNAIEMIGTMTIAYYVVSRFDLSEFLDLLSAAFGIIAVACSYLIVFVPFYGRSDYGASGWCGFYGEKNHFGTVMGFAVVTLLITALQSTGRKRFVLASLAAYCAFLIVGSQSATALLVTAVTTFFVISIRLCRSKRYGNFVAFGLAITSFATIVFIAATGFTTDSFFALVGRDATLTGRTDFWPGLVRAINDRPFFGYGYDGFFDANGPADQYIGNATGWWHPSHAHNSYYQIALDVGFVGGAAFGATLLLGFFRAGIHAFRQASPTEAWPLAIILFLTLGSFTETYFGQRNTTESILFALAILYPGRLALTNVSKGGTLRNAVEIFSLKQFRNSP